MNEETKTALVVDDESVTRESQRDFLIMVGGFDVTTAPSREEALEYNNQKFDLLLMDGLKGDCMELYSEINAGRKVIITGDVEIFEEAQKREWEVYLKPFYLGEIIQNA